MKARNLFTLNTIICFLFAIPLLTIPSEFLSLFMISGDSLHGVGLTICKAYGGMILALGVATWIGRDAKPKSLTEKSLLWIILIENMAALYAYITAITSNSVNQLVWAIVLLTATLVLWSAVLLKKEHTI